MQLFLPLVQATPRVNLSEGEAKALTERIQDAGTEVVKAKVRVSIYYNIPYWHAQIPR